MVMTHRHSVRRHDGPAIAATLAWSIAGVIVAKLGLPKPSRVLKMSSAGPRESPSSRGGTLRCTIHVRPAQ
jgi:hypothetical protein